MSFGTDRPRGHHEYADLGVSAWESPPVCWATLDSDTASAALRTLSVWVRWVARRYALDHRTLPPCWHQHGALIEELSALHTGWQSAFSATAPGNAPLDWQAMFAAARLRLQEWVARTGCRADEHREDHAQAWTGAGDRAEPTPRYHPPGFDSPGPY